jgi:predicted Zn-dependent peptidase
VSAIPSDGDTAVVRLGNGVRVLAIALPHLESVNVSVFVRTGSSHEPRRLNGISHFVEHMAFKGTRTRSCQQINWDAERLGADVNAHTDKDHTAYHMRGLAADGPRFVAMLGDIVLASSFPDAELERERQVILHELTEDEEDVLATADKLFDRLSFGNHPVAQPVIGSRLTIQHIGRDELLDYVSRQYTGANIVVGVAGRFDLDAIVAAAETAFAGVAAGAENRVEAPAYGGGIASRVQPGYGQTHGVMGYPIPSLREEHHPAMVAAALFGEGMSSPLMDEIRERRGLVYYASCAADVNEICGQFVVEASTSPAQLDEFLAEVRRLLARQADAIAADDLERARRQIAVRTLRTQERPVRRLENAALDLFVHGRVRSRAETLARVEAVGAGAVRDAFAAMRATPVALAIAGRVKKGAVDRARELFA